MTLYLAPGVNLSLYIFDLVPFHKGWRPDRWCIFSWDLLTVDCPIGQAAAHLIQDPFETKLPPKTCQVQLHTILVTMVLLPLVWMLSLFTIWRPNPSSKPLFQPNMANAKTHSNSSGYPLRNDTPSPTS